MSEVPLSSLNPLLRKAGIRLPGKGISNSHGARPVHLIITTIKWIQGGRLSIQNSLSEGSCEGRQVRRGELLETPAQRLPGLTSHSLTLRPLNFTPQIPDPKPQAGAA